MRTAFMMVVFAASAACLAHAQDIVADWQGVLKAGGGELRLVLHVAKGEGGGLRATLDSVDQGANGIPVSSITLKDSKLNLVVDAVRRFNHSLSTSSARPLRSRPNTNLPNLPTWTAPGWARSSRAR